jgi:hypothetical protein
LILPPYLAPCLCSELEQPWLGPGGSVGVSTPDQLPVVADSSDPPADT